MTKALVRVKRQIGAIAQRAGSGELPEYVRADEVAKAIELTGRAPVKALLRCLWLTGARISEVLALEVEGIDFRAKAVKLVTLKQKKKKIRVLPLPGEFLGELAMLINSEKITGRVFPWSRSRAFELVRDALVKAGVEKKRAHPHALRHGHAVHALEHGAPLNIVQRTLGHSSVLTTSTYLKVTGEDVRRYYDGITW